MPEDKGYWIARWIHPDGEESAPIPVWIDREGNGHFLLQATMVLGEDRPFLVQAPRVSACQVLSLFRESGGAFRAVASEVWIALPGQTGGMTYRWTGKGGWHAETLVAVRNAFSPFLSAFRETADPEIQRLAGFRWPDVVLIRMPGKPLTSEEAEDGQSPNAGTE